MLAYIAAAALTWSPGLVPGDHCSLRGERTPWSDAAKSDTRERVSEAAVALGASAAIVAYHELIVYRESWGGDAGARHTLGNGEDGLGAHGLSLRWHAGKWPGGDADPAFCTPEVSTLIAHEIMRRAVTRHGAANLWQIQSVYGGWVEREDGRSVFTLPATKRRDLCARAARRGVDCGARIVEADLGERLPIEERRAWALGRARRWVAQHRGRATPPASATPGAGTPGP